MSAKKTDEGFTLLEVVVTVIIIGIAILPLFSIFNNSLEKTQETKVQLVANQLAQQCIESVKSKDYKELKALDTDQIDTGETDRDKDRVTFMLNKETNGVITNLPSMPEGYEANIVLEPQGIYQVIPDTLVVELHAAGSEYWVEINQNRYELSSVGRIDHEITIQYTKPNPTKEEYEIAIKYNGNEVYKQTNKGFLSTIQLISHIEHKVKVDNQTGQEAVLNITQGKTTESKVSVESLNGANQINSYDIINYTMAGGEIDIKYDGIGIATRSSGDSTYGPLIGTFLGGQSTLHKLVVLSNGVGNINVYNETSKSLDVEVITGTTNAMQTKMEVKQGIVKKSYRELKSAQAPYRLYRLKVDIKDEKTNDLLMRIETTKME